MPFTTTCGRLDLLKPHRDEAQLPPPRLVEGVVLDHHHVADRYWSLRLHAPKIAETAQPGQFVMLTVAQSHENAPVLARPMAIYTSDAASGSIEVMYGVVGLGTTRLTRTIVGATITTVGPWDEASPFTLTVVKSCWSDGASAPALLPTWLSRRRELACASRRSTVHGPRTP